MNLQDILLKNYRSPELEAILAAPVTRRHYIDRFPTSTAVLNSKCRPSELSSHPKAKAIYKRVRKFLLDHPGATAAEIANYLKSDTTKIGNYTQRMCDAGVIRYEIGTSPKGGGRPKFCYYLAEAV